MLSINARIIISATMVLGIFIAATGLALDRAFHDSALSSRQERLLGQVYLLIAAADVDAAGKITLPSTLSESRFSVLGSGLYGMILDENGAVLWRSPSALDVTLPSVSVLAPGQHLFDLSTGGRGVSYFVYSFGVNWAASTRHFLFTFTVCEDLAGFTAELDAYRHSLWGWLGAMAFFLIVAQMAVLRWSLRPLRRVEQDLSAIESGRQERLEGPYPREIDGLTENLNALLSSERARQKRYRDALADLAHSLKTPLAVLRGSMNSTTRQELLSDAVEEQVARMDRIVEYQLQRAGAAGRSTGLAAPVAVRPAAEKILATLNKVYREKAIQASADIDREIFFRGDEGDLIEILGNLGDNAYKWCKSIVQFRARLGASGLAVMVEDDGPGIDAAVVDTILERGVRADQLVPGHGIGLAVVHEIVKAYRGRITIGTSSLGGAAITLEFPLT